MGEEQREQSRSGRDIGGIPPALNVDRRESCRFDFQLFCEVYYSQTFNLGWSADHLLVIEKMQRSILQGELFAIAMPRGSGKTSLCEAACLWAILYGHCRFAVVIAATKDDHAIPIIESLKSEIENNELIGEDFPAACHPVRKLENIAQRAAGQLCNGKPTNISWKGDKAVLPSIAGSECSGSIIRVAGITGSIRGLREKLPTGETVRPDLVLIDDPQTDESAHSPTQVASRMRTLKRSILGMAGPGGKIAGFAAVTVVAPEDLADQLLDREANPEWRGERMKMVYAFPHGADDEETKRIEALWRRYDELRREGIEAEQGLAKATRFYIKNRKAMDAGSEVAWEERYPREGDNRCVSAIQHAMTLKLADPEGFAAERQNEPSDPLGEQRVKHITTEAVMGLVSPYPRGVAPLEATTLTAMVDVQGDSLWWVVCAWTGEFTGWVIDYGTEPDAPGEHYTLADVEKRGLSTRVLDPAGEAIKKASAEAAWYAGLERLRERLLDRKWAVADDPDEKAVLTIDKMLIDAGYQPSRDTIHRWIRDHGLESRVTPSYGVGVTAKKPGFMSAAKKRGESWGTHWRMPQRSPGRAVRHVRFDANYWKGMVRERLLAPEGATGTLRLFAPPRGRTQTHRVFAENLTAEYATLVSANGLTVEEWDALPSRDNHYLDGAVGCAVAASMSGCLLGGEGEVKVRKKKKPVSFAAMKRGARRSA